MKAVLRAFRTIDAWQTTLLVAMSVVAAALSYSAYAVVSGVRDTDLGEGELVIPVSFGNLTRRVNVNARLVFPKREMLTFGTQGTIGEILVTEGQEVERGQPLAELDALTIAALDKAVVRARLGLRDAEEELDTAARPHTPLEIAQAELGIAIAELYLKNSLDAAAALSEPPSAIAAAQAEAAVANAELSLSLARDALAAAMAPTPLEIARAEARVADAEVTLDQTLAALDEMKNGPTEEEMAEAQAQVDSAGTSLGIAREELRLARRDSGGELEAAQESVETALLGYQAVMVKWLGIEISPTDAELAPTTFLESKEIDLARLFDRTLRFDDVGKSFWAVGSPPDDPETPWNEKTVYIWLNFWPGTIFPTCQSTVTAAQGLCISQEMDDAWITYDGARDALEATEIQGLKNIADSEGAVARADGSLTVAQEALDLLEASPDALEVKRQETQLAIALASLQDAEDAMSKLMEEPDPLMLETRRKQVKVAEAAIESAREALTGLNGGPDLLELENRNRQAAVARANLDDAKELLAELNGDSDPLAIALLEAEVASAQSELESALQAREHATLVSSMPGVVASVVAEPGDGVNADTPIVEIVDTTIIEAHGTIDEIDVLQVQVGASAFITMDALPDQTLRGHVSEVSTDATSQQDVASFPLRIAMEVPQDLDLREGMGAFASVVIERQTGVVMVPLLALYGTFGDAHVRVIADGRIEERPVVLGMSDDFWTVVEQGLERTENIVVEVDQEVVDRFRLGRRFGRR